MSPLSAYQMMFEIATLDHDALAFADHLGDTSRRAVILQLVVLAWLGGAGRDKCDCGDDLFAALAAGHLRLSFHQDEDALLAELEPIKDALQELEDHSGGLADPGNCRILARMNSFPLPDLRHNKHGH